MKQLYEVEFAKNNYLWFNEAKDIVNYLDNVCGIKLKDCEINIVNSITPNTFMWLDDFKVTCILITDNMWSRLQWYIQ